MAQFRLRHFFGGRKNEKGFNNLLGARNSTFACGLRRERNNNYACAHRDTRNASKQTEESTPAPVATETHESKKTIGDITIVDGFECQIKEVNWYSPYDFDPAFIEPEEDYEYIVIVLSEKNTTNETENAPMLNLLSADGTECLNKAGLSLYKKQYKMNFGATLAGTTAEAYVLYQIPEGAESFVFQIMSNGFGSSSDYNVFDRSDIQ